LYDSPMAAFFADYESIA